MKMHSEIVHINKAEPASMREIALYLFTAGRYGRTYRAKLTAVRMWRSPQNVNCRCSCTEVTK